MDTTPATERLTCADVGVHPDGHPGGHPDKDSAGTRAETQPTPQVVISLGIAPPKRRSREAYSTQAAQRLRRSKSGHSTSWYTISA
jgi:hypothetical protein